MGTCTARIHRTTFFFLTRYNSKFPPERTTAFSSVLHVTCRSGRLFSASARSLGVRDEIIRTNWCPSINIRPLVSVPITRHEFRGCNVYQKCTCFLRWRITEIAIHANSFLRWRKSSPPVFLHWHFRLAELVISRTDISSCHAKKMPRNCKEQARQLPVSFDLCSRRLQSSTPGKFGFPPNFHRIP